MARAMRRAAGERMNNTPTYPAARTLETATWNAAILKGDIAAAVRSLKQDDGGGLLIASSACGPVCRGPIPTGSVSTPRAPRGKVIIQQKLFAYVSYPYKEHR